MARKRRKKTDDLKLPDFDEKDFMKKEMTTSVMMVGTVALALLMAFVAGALTWTLKDPRIPLVLGLLGIFLLKLVFDLMKIDTSKVEKTKWAGIGFSYFFTFLAIWVLLINPPLIDLIPPTIENTTPEVQEMGSDVEISVDVNDNQGIRSVRLHIMGPDGYKIGPVDMESRGRNTYSYDIANPPLGRYNFSVEVKDKGDFFAEKSYSFEVVPYQPPVISLSGFVPGQEVRRGEPIPLEIKDNAGVVLVFYGFDGAEDFGTTKEPEKKIKIDDPKNSRVDIKTKNLELGEHTVTVCAMDSVPHSTVYKTIPFTIV